MQHAQHSQKGRFSDHVRFLQQWIESPKLVGALSPSGPMLARKMASYVDLSREGPIVELGPGTGPVTKALLARGIPIERLLLVEYDRQFCHHLAQRFPGVKIVQGDAYDLKTTLRDHLQGRIGTIVSSLPLLMRPEHDRIALVHEAFELMGPDGLFIQFTYKVAGSPAPLRADSAGRVVVAKGSAPVLMNFPPARVWRYRMAGHPGAPGK